MLSGSGINREGKWRSSVGSRYDLRRRRATERENTEGENNKECEGLVH